MGSPALLVALFPDRVHSRQRVHVPRSHFPQRKPRQGARRLRQDRRDPIGRQAAACRFLHQRHYPRHVRRGHRRAGRAGVILPVRQADGAAAGQIKVVVRVECVEHRPGRRAGGHDVYAGAVTSGWYSGLPGIPRDEKSASQAGRFWPVWSAQWTAEFVGSGVTSLHPAATPITHGATLYGLRVFWSGPSFPAANTTVIPLSCTFLVALLIGSFGSNGPLVPQELFTTLML